MTNFDALILKCFGHTPALDAFLLNEWGDTFNVFFFFLITSRLPA